MTSWKAFSHGTDTFDLSHLDAFDHTFIQPAQEDKPDRSYRVWVRFGHHCFTSGKAPTDDPSLEYPLPLHDRRTFDRTRWELSKLLPGVVRDLMNRKVSHTGHGNFYTLEIVDTNGNRIEYEVYFELSRAAGDKRLHLVVTSAFPRDPARATSRPTAKPIRFSVILHNVQMNKPIRVQR
jgi:hypothetical protein